MAKPVKRIKLADNALALSLFGRDGENLKRFEKKLGVKLDTRGNVLSIQGDAERAVFAEGLIIELYSLLEKGFVFTPPDLDHAVNILSCDEGLTLADVFMDTIDISYRNRTIAPKSPAQKRYVDAMKRFDMVFSIGPAGTGKTYLAMAAAVEALAKKSVDRIILTRPAVEAGEKLGFLPGDLAAKVDPYLRPLFDALHDMMDLEKAQKLLEQGTIEVAPIAFMRGRTLNDSFVILDEAQNTTSEQLKMFLTRLGFGSKAVITGDITQIDLPLARPSGLVEAQKTLKDVKGIEFVYFSEIDVVRHPLVGEIVKAYDRAEGERAAPIVEEA